MPNCLFPGCIFHSNKKYCHRHNEYNDQEPQKVYIIPKMSAKRKAEQPKIIAEKKELAGFYAKMLSESPKTCMECGCDLKPSMVINPRSIVCHILPKRIFNSIAKNPLNVVYLCNDHHNTLDNFSPVKMKTFPLLVERVKKLIPLIKESELKSIPEYYLK